MPDRKLDRLQAALWAREVIAHPDRWLILDTETTGLDGSDEIVQIAAIAADGEALLNTLVKPTCDISDEAIGIHGIHPPHVADAPTFDQVFLQLLKAIGRRKLAAYNLEFDLRMIQQSLYSHNICLSIPINYWINGSSAQCVMHRYAEWIGDWSDYHGGYRWQKLPGSNHTALGDCIATLNVIRQMAASYEEEFKAELSEPPIENSGAKLVEMPTIAATATDTGYDDIPF